MFSGSFPPGALEVFEGHELVDFVRIAEAVLHQAHHHAAGEVLVALADVHVAGLDAGHRVQPLRHRLEVRRAVVGGVVRRGRLAVVGALRRGQQICGLLLKVAGPLGGRQHERGGAVVLQAAVEQVERLHDPARVVVVLSG